MVTLRELREAYGLTQEALAARFGLPVSIIRSWEEGRSSPNDRQVASLARFFGVSPEAIVAASRLAPLDDRPAPITPPAAREQELARR